MSRIIVKNLGTRVSEKELRDTFGVKGYITDVQLKFTKDGRFRHFAFIGFQREDSSAEAVKTFNGSYIGANKVTVELCHSLSDSNKPRPWSKYSKGSSAYQALNLKENFQKSIKKDKSKPGALQKLEQLKEEAEFQEFVASHHKVDQGVWSNDGIIPSVAKVENEDERNVSDNNDEKEEELKSKKITDMEFLKSKVSTSLSAEESGSKEKSIKSEVKSLKYVFPYTIKLRGIPENARKKDIKHFLTPIKPKSIRRPQKERGLAFVGLLTEKELKVALNKDKGFMGANRIRVIDYKKKPEPVTNSEMSEKEKKWQEAQEALEKEEGLGESGRLFIRNLSYTITEEDVQNLFSKYGPTTEVNLPIDRHTRKLMGFGLVTFVFPEHAQKAYEDLDGSVFQGRMLHILPAKPENKENSEETEGENYKVKKSAKQKSEAMSSHNWNTLFLGSNTVADAMASKYNTSKQQVLSDDLQGNVAVRMALGETQLVNETKQFLLQNGVQLDAFNQAPLERSKTAILVKNLPANTAIDDIRQLFEKFGVLGRVLLPPSGVTAIVEFLEPAEARIAFRKLAYKKFRYVPLYLEWAPSNCFYASTAQDDAKKETEDKPLSIKSEEPEDIEESGTTLFVKNLNFCTTDENLKQHFNSAGSLVYATVSKKKNPKQQGEFLSMGYGFVCYRTKESAQTALKTLQGSQLDGHRLELKVSNRTIKPPTGGKGRKTVKISKQKSSKILVRNIPFQANVKEVTELFKTFGELKAVRLPQKTGGTGTHRGFAFVDFLTKQEAKQAFEALCQSTHLYGRRLVLEWANPEETIEDVRKRTAEHFIGDAPKKKRGKSTFSLEESKNAEER